METTTREPSEGAPAERREGGPFPDVSPLDQGPLPPVTATSPDEVRVLVARAREAQAGWAERSAADRALAMMKLKARILSRAREIAELVHRECGKPLEEAALAEVLPNADLVEYW